MNHNAGSGHGLRLSVSPPVSDRDISHYGSEVLWRPLTNPSGRRTNHYGQGTMMPDYTGTLALPVYQIR